MPHNQYPAGDPNYAPPVPADALAQRARQVSEDILRKSYTTLPDREKLAEGRIHNQTVGLLVPPYETRSNNPLNREGGANGNVLAVVGLPEGQQSTGEWTRREVAIVDFGPEAETRPVAAYRYQDQRGLSVNIGQTARGCRYGLTAYNYEVDGLVITYVPLEPGKPVVLGRNTQSSGEYASSVLGLKTGAPDLARIADEQVTITAEGNHILVDDHSQYGTQIAVIGDIFDPAPPTT